MTPVRGGDVASTFRVDLNGGDTVFAKTHASPPPGFFTTEAASLAWLREAEAVRVPAVAAVSDGSVDRPAYLVLEWIQERRPGAAGDVPFGAALAALHDAGAPCFGREDRATTGSRGLPTEAHSSWSDFYANCRLLPLARLARESASLPDAAIAGLERLAASLDRFDDGQPPARLHGDLWAGNRLVDTHGVNWLIDPAAHGGHQEFDLAMMRLFGGFSPACFEAYAQRRPLAQGWEERVPLHQIAPLVVHAIKFGGSYVSAAAAAIVRY
ncbi:MAG: fructosamine kinase family protein [Acidimicrobiales bacterium]